MSPVQLTVIAIWILWALFYFRFAWASGGRESRNGLMLVLPILLPFERFWRSETAVSRIRLMTTALALLFAHVTLQNLGLLGPA